ncbi:NADPH-dependent diflavin oxidoreductase 1 [Dictyocoela muelleri]|nr:NADPH-dependent diflavin oxidoreductase 1 [Dictyocoela muelleri]
MFGLGDSSYEKFNYAARKLSKRLKMIGAKVVEVLGDEQDEEGYLTGFKEFLKIIGVETKIENWIDFFDKIFQDTVKNEIIDKNTQERQIKPIKIENKSDKEFKKYFKNDTNLNIYEFRSGEENNVIKTLNNQKFESLNNQKYENLNNQNFENSNNEQKVQNSDNHENKLNFCNDDFFSSSNSFECKVVEKEIIDTDFNEILRLSLDLDYDKFMPGDAIMIKPKNYNTNEFIKYNEYDPSLIIFFNNKKYTLYEFIESEVDFNCIPPQPFFYFLYRTYKLRFLRNSQDENIFSEKLKTF